MLRRTAKISVRLGVLVVIALIIKKLVDSQKPTGPAAVVPVRPPTPKPDARIPDPEPAAATVEEATAVEPEPEPEPESEPESEPEPEAAPEPEPEPERPLRAEPLKAKKAAKKATKKAAKKAAPAKRVAPPHVTPDTPVGAILSWVEPVGGVCPPSHPIKAKLGSRVFRRPGMASYENSKPDRCYASEGAARRGGFNEAQR